MVASRFMLTGLAAIAGVFASVSEEKLFRALLKRQDPGTPAYNCHDNCGNAVTISKAGGDVCKNPTFLADYANCLQCSGPDNQNIWRYYGSTLTKVAGGCGLSTTPKTGKQPDVPPAGTSSTTSSSAAAGSSAAPAQSSAAPAGSSQAPAPAPTSAAPISSRVASVSGSSAAPAPLVTSSGGAAIPTTNTNSTSSPTSRPAQQSVNAAAAAGGETFNAAGTFAAVVMGMMYGLGN